jgi:hypothetical protein
MRPDEAAERINGENEGASRRTFQPSSALMGYRMRASWRRDFIGSASQPSCDVVRFATPQRASDCFRSASAANPSATRTKCALAK